MAVNKIVDHPTAPDFWRHEPPKPRPCVECKVETPWIYLDLCYLHPECDFPEPTALTPKK